MEYSHAQPPSQSRQRAPGRAPPDSGMARLGGHAVSSRWRDAGHRLWGVAAREGRAGAGGVGQESWSDPVPARRCPASRSYLFLLCLPAPPAAIPAKGMSVPDGLGSVRLLTEPGRLSHLKQTSQLLCFSSEMVIRPTKCIELP